MKLLRFLRELFHKDHMLQDTIKVVMISTEKPSADVENVIILYEESIHLIVGSIFNEKILEKSDINNSEAIFVMANQFDKGNEEK